MKLHDLQVGQRFTFSDKHRGKVFEVTDRTQWHVLYMDVATQQVRETYSNRETFRMEVDLVTDNRVVELTPEDIEILKSALVEYYLRACEVGRQSTDGEAIDKLLIKITGSAGRRVVLPEGE